MIAPRVSNRQPPLFVPWRTSSPTPDESSSGAPDASLARSACGSSGLCTHPPRGTTPLRAWRTSSPTPCERAARRLTSVSRGSCRRRSRQAEIGPTAKATRLAPAATAALSSPRRGSSSCRRRLCHCSEERRCLSLKVAHPASIASGQNTFVVSCGPLATKDGRSTGERNSPLMTIPGSWPNSIPLGTNRRVH